MTDIRSAIALVLVIALCGCSLSNSVYPEKVAAAVVKAVLSEQENHSQTTCVAEDMKKSPGIPWEVVVGKVGAEAVPKPMRICSAIPYYEVSNLSVINNRAQIDLDYHCGSMCGSGRTYELAYEAGVWRIVNVRGRWVS